MRRRLIPWCSNRCFQVSSYPVLAKLSLGYPSPWGRLPTCYSPVRLLMYYYIPIDLHVLGTPPAFILSQDQTLKYLFIFLFFYFSWPLFSGLNFFLNFIDVVLVFFFLLSFQRSVACRPLVNDSFLIISHCFIFCQQLFL